MSWTKKRLFEALNFMNWGLTEILLGCFAFLLFYYWYRRPPGFPRGPRGIPVLGVVPFMGKFSPRTLRDWGKTYGPIMGVRLGRREAVVLNDFETIQEALVKNKDVFSGRPVHILFTKFFQGILSRNYDATWEATRRFGITTLRGYGVGKRSMEERVQEEAGYLNEAIQHNEGKAFDICNIVTYAVSNNICSVIFGKRFDYDDEKFQEMTQNIGNLFSHPGLTKTIQTLMFLPFLKRTSFVYENLQMFSRINNDLFDFVGEIITSHKKSFDPENLRDVIDAYIAGMKKQKKHFTDENLLHFIRELFIAGTETTTSTLRWGILCLLHYPEEQRKLYQEILKVVGHDGVVVMSHRSELPYTQAFIEELYRYRTLLPLALLHATTEDTTLNGFFIPKETMILPNIWAVHNDLKTFNQPERFNPERHLDAQRRFVKSHHVIPFSVGPRHCLGEQLGRREVFIFIHRFPTKWLLGNGNVMLCSASSGIWLKWYLKSYFNVLSIPMCFLLELLLYNSFVH